MADWTTAYKNDLPDSAFLHIKPGGKKDGEGKTTPRDLRMLPVKDANGKVDLPHLRDAISRLGQPKTDIPAATKKQLQAKARRMLLEASRNKSISLSDIQSNISDAVRSQSPAGQARAMTQEDYPEYWYVRDVRFAPTYIVVETRSGCFKVPYSLDTETGAVSLAARDQWKLVIQDWIEVGA